MLGWKLGWKVKLKATGAQPGIFRGRKGSWNRSTLIHTSCTTYKRRKNFLVFFFKIFLKLHFKWELTPKCIQTWQFFPILEYFFSIFKNDRGNLAPSPFLDALQSYFLFLNEADTAQVFSSRQCPNSAKNHFRL